MKLFIKTGLASLLLLAISCTKEPLYNLPKASTSIETENNSALQITEHYIGEHYGGGIIFYLDSTGDHGLIADTVDLSTAIAWWNGTYTTTGATKTGIGAGKSNTRKIILSQGKTGNYAALMCANYSGSGYIDWYLPSKNELNKLYLKRNKIGGFSNVGYWSSTESSVFGYAWYQDFTFGTQDNLSKNNITVNVRPIRAF